MAGRGETRIRHFASERASSTLIHETLQLPLVSTIVDEQHCNGDCTTQQRMNTGGTGSRNFNAPFLMYWDRCQLIIVSDMYSYVCMYHSEHIHHVRVPGIHMGPGTWYLVAGKE